MHYALEADLGVNLAGVAVILEATLSFLGAGVPPPAPSWGSMIAGGRDYIAGAWWLSILPGLAIMLVVFAIVAPP